MADGAATNQPGAGRERLLDLVIEHMLATGTATSSLRALAGEIGTSHRMLIYHFGGQQGLIAAVVDEVEARQRAALAELGAKDHLSAAQLSLEFWRRLSSPKLRAVETLFFQLYIHLLEVGQNHTAARLSTAWHEPVLRLLTDRGFTRAEARRLTRLGIAVYRGLLLDLLATGDKRAVDAAARTYISAVFASAPAPTRRRRESPAPR